MRKNVVFGAGDKGEKFLVKWHSKIEIAEFFDNCKVGDFYGYTIRKPYYDQNIFIIIAVDGFERYFSIRQQLLKLGYNEFEDFIPYTIFKKKVAIAYGNCHMMTIKSYLELSSEFAKDYGFYPFPPIQGIPESLPIDSIIPQCELFIHQAIRKENNYGEQYSSNNFLKYTNKNCCILSIPNLHGLPICFFPQLQLVKKPIKLLSGLSIHRDTEIEKWVTDNISIEEMERMISEGGVYSEKDILNSWEEFKIKLENREKEWDIKISDYIYAHYQEEKLFTDRWHISTFLAKEIANRTLEQMGYSLIEDIILPALDSQEVFIYEDVKRALGLRFSEKSIRNFSEIARLNKSQMTLKDYLEMYIQIYALFKEG